jgi:3-phenylpropionate/trans-cinnamate dioxygenase ferredoxin subunit
MTNTAFYPAAHLAELPPGEKKVVALGGKEIILCHTADTIFAIINRCSHAKEPLACGVIKHGWIACPMHGARFDLETGEAINPPATQPIETFAVRVRGGMIEVEV